MVSDRDVNQATLSARRQLAGWRADRAAGRAPSEIAPQVSLTIDVLVALRDEAPAAKLPVIDRLVDALEAFRRGLVH